MTNNNTKKKHTIISVYAPDVLYSAIKKKVDTSGHKSLSDCVCSLLMETLKDSDKKIKRYVELREQLRKL